MKPIEYARFIDTGQYGRLWVTSGSHARGKTLFIFVLPEGEEGKWNGSGNPPTNKNAVKVYGVVGGQYGWTEKYGWLHHGKWEKDFMKLAEQKLAEFEADKEARISADSDGIQDKLNHEVKLLSDY